MKKFIILGLSILTFSLVSCENENSIDNNKEVIKLEEITIKNGRLCFPNKSTFQNFYYDLDNKNEDEVATVLENKFYKKDFYSLKPIINKNTEFEIKRHLNKLKSIKISNLSGNKMSDEDIFENFDDLEEILGEDVFQSFLNQNAEIQVADKIYKYTDKGILISSEEFVNEIYTFMNLHNVKSLNDFENIDTSGNYPTFNIDGGLKQVTEHVESYITEKTADPNNTNPTLPGDDDVIYASGGQNNGSNGSTSTNNTADDVVNIANGLELCSPNSPLIGNLFGTTKVCIKRFGDAQRVKIKYYSVDFYLAFAIGIKVKHQHKGWWIWDKQDTDKMALGINSVTWYFDHSKVFNNTTNTSITNYYTHEGKLYSSFNGYSNAVYVGQNKPLPPMPFANTVDLMIEWVGNTIGYEPSEEEVRQFFYSNLYNQGKSILNSLGKPMNKVGVIINQNGQTIVQYYDFKQTCNNCSKLEKVFDWGIVTPQINYTFDSAGSDHFGFGAMTFDFKHPEITHLNAYGMAKRSGNWYGYRMKF